MAIELSLPRMAQYITEQPISSTLPTLPLRHAAKETLIAVADPTRVVQRMRISDAGLLGTLARIPAEVRKKLIMETGSRIANGVRLGLLDTDYGIMHHKAREHAQTKDHGFEHDRRHAKWVRALYEHSPNITITQTEIALAMPLFSPFHDANQLDISYTNLTAEKSEKFRPKDAHDFAGALKTLSYRDRYAKEAGVSQDSARVIVGFAAAMMLWHDEPAILAVVQEQTAQPNGRKAYDYDLKGHRIMLHGDALIQRVEEGIDVLSLSPRQIAELTAFYKQQANPKFVSESTPHGLHPRFEKDFADALLSVEADDVPLLERARVTDQTRQEFLVAQKIEVLADQLDMVVPFGEGLLRMFPLEISRNRPLSEPNMRERVLGAIGNPIIDSDLGRKLWEIRTLTDRIADPILLKSPSIRKIIADVQVRSLLEIKRIGAILMRGDETEIQQLVEQMQFAQLPSFAEKVLSKAHLPRRRFNGDNPFAYATAIAADLQDLDDTQTKQMGDRLQTKIVELQGGVMQVMDSLKDARKNGTEGLHTYSAEEIAQFEELCDELISGSEKLRGNGIASLIDTHGRRTVRQIQQSAAAGKPMTAPFTTHASTQTFHSAPVRTWSARPQQLLHNARQQLIA